MDAAVASEGAESGYREKRVEEHCVWRLFQSWGYKIVLRGEKATRSANCGFVYFQLPGHYFQMCGSWFLRIYGILSLASQYLS